MKTTKSVSAVVPTRDEVENIAPLVEQIAATGVSFHEIIFVDAASTDGTREAVQALTRNHPVRLLEQDQDEPGLASAIMIGAHAATGDVLVVMDADLSHPPERFPDLLEPIFGNTADLVVGSRYVSGGSTPGWPLWRRTMSRTGAVLAYPLTGVCDSLSGFFAIERQRLIDLSPPTVGFKLVFETIARGRPGLRVNEIPIAFRDRARGRSKMSFPIAVRFLGRWVAAIFRRALR